MGLMTHHLPESPLRIVAGGSLNRHLERHLLHRVAAVGPARLAAAAAAALVVRASAVAVRACGERKEILDRHAAGPVRKRHSSAAITSLRPVII